MAQFADRTNLMNVPKELVDQLSETLIIPKKIDSDSRAGSIADYLEAHDPLSAATKSFNDTASKMFERLRGGHEDDLTIHHLQLPNLSPPMQVAQKALLSRDPTGDKDLLTIMSLKLTCSQRIAE